MNKTIITGLIAGTAILSPVVGMGITQTREAILGLAPDEAVLELADKIDQSTAKSDATASTVEALQAKISEQESQIAGYQAQLNVQNSAIADAQANSEKQSTCAMLYSKMPICNTDGYKTAAGFERTKSEIKSFFSGEIATARLSEANAKYSECQKIVAQCN